jgi:hypothetical protein
VGWYLEFSGRGEAFVVRRKSGALVLVLCANKAGTTSPNALPMANSVIFVFIFIRYRFLA